MGLLLHRHDSSSQQRITSHQRLRPSQWLLSLSALCLIGLSLVVNGSPVPAASPENLVLFTAEWCAKCRVVDTPLKQVGQTYNIPLVVIDVDASDAQKKAGDLGLKIPKGDLPQGFLVVPSGATQILDAETAQTKSGDALTQWLQTRIQPLLSGSPKLKK